LTPKEKTMKTIGKEIRMERIINRKSHKTVIVPLDHGVSVGPISGLEDIAKTINDIAEGGANAVLMHKGIDEETATADTDGT